MNAKGSIDDLIWLIGGMLIVIIVIVIILSFFGMSFTDFTTGSMEAGEDFFEPFKS